MPTRVLIIGAAGKIGSAALEACLEKNGIVTAFVRTPSKLPTPLQNHPNLRIHQGDATSRASLIEAMQSQDAVIQAAVYGSNSPWGSSDSERVVEAVVTAVQEVQDVTKERMKLWVLSGEVVMDVPGRKGKILGDAFPVHPEHYRNLAFLRERAGDVDWSLLCPGGIQDGEPVGPLVTTVDEPGLWEKPAIFGNLPFVGLMLNVFWNLTHQRLTFKSIGSFLADNLDYEERFIRKRVCVLEDSSRSSPN